MQKAKIKLLSYINPHKEAEGYLLDVYVPVLDKIIKIFMTKSYLWNVYEAETGANLTQNNKTRKEAITNTVKFLDEEIRKHAKNKKEAKALWKDLTKNKINKF